MAMLTSSASAHPPGTQEHRNLGEPLAQKGSRDGLVQCSPRDELLGLGKHVSETCLLLIFPFASAPAGRCQETSPWTMTCPGADTRYPGALKMVSQGCRGPVEKRLGCQSLSIPSPRAGQALLCQGMDFCTAKEAAFGRFDVGR